MSTKSTIFTKDTPIDEVFEGAVADINRQLIKDARNKPTPTVTMAVGVLTLASGERRLPYITMEYGDGEGVRQVADFIEKSRQFLQEGEKLDYVEITIPVCELGL